MVVPVVLDEGREACSSQPVEEGAAGNWEHQQHDVQAACPSAASSKPACRCSTLIAQQGGQDGVRGCDECTQMWNAEAHWRMMCASTGARSAVPMHG